MSAHHHHHHHHSHDSSRNIGVVLLLNASFAVIELIGGYLTGSVAILADALHDFGDSLTLGMAYILERLSQKKQTKMFSYGYRRLSLLSALFTSLTLIIGSVVIMVHAVPRLINPVQPVVEGMLALAVLGIVVNGYAAWRSMRGTTLNERTISWHMMEDLFGWVVVLIGSIIMMIWDVPIVDPLLSIIFTTVILVGVMRTLFATMRLFLQGTPSGLDSRQLQGQILAIPNVVGVHDLHIWSLDGARHVMTMHAVVDEGLNLQQIAAIKVSIRNLVAEFGDFHLTLEVESAEENCPDQDCVPH